MTKYLYTLSILLICFQIGCKRSTEPIVGIKDTHTTKNNTVYFYLSDTLGNYKTQFQTEEDIIFNFGVINNLDTVVTFTKGHGGTPIVSFLVFKGDSLFGISDEGYLYPAIVIGGAIVPNDTLKYSASWHENPFHQNKLEIGKYCTTISPYIWLDDFNLDSHLDTIYFEILEN